MATHPDTRPHRHDPRAAVTSHCALCLALALALTGMLGCRPRAPSPSLDLLERSTKALREVQSVRCRITFSVRSAEAWGSVVQMEVMDIEYVTEGEGLARVYLPHEGALPDEIVCTGSECWQRVGRHPWSAALSVSLMSFTGYLEGRQSGLSRAEVSDTEYVVETSQILVTWSADADTEGELHGQSWLDTNTFLPTREVYSMTDSDGRFTAETVVEYLEYDRPMGIVRPVPATVTPVPTISVGDRPLLPTHEEPAMQWGLVLAPEEFGAYAGVVVLGDAGSQAEIPTYLAKRMAEYGYVALAYCYTTCPGAPSMLVEVDVAGVADAVAYLRAHPSVGSDSIGLVGVGRGAELALIAAALGVDAQAVVAISAPTQVGPGASPDREAWVFRGERLPFTEIPVEEIDAPILVIHGQEDAARPVTEAYRLAERRWSAGKPCELAVYPTGDETLYRSNPDVTARIAGFIDRNLFRLR